MSELLGGVTRFGRLTFIEEATPKGTIRRGLFRCDCGVEKPMALNHIRNGRVVSCGCESARRSCVRFTKHGGYRTPEYKSWNAMHQRCLNLQSTSYPDYGGRGITICPEWRGEGGLKRFVTDMGQRPAGTTLDRIDSNGNYEPGNCRWATPKRQQNNRRVSKFLTFQGETLTQSEWTERLRFGKNIISERLRKGWTVEKALTTPVEPRTKRS